MQPSPLHQPMTLTATSSILPLMVDLWLAPVGTGNVALRLAYEGGQRIKPYGNPNRGVCKHQQSVLLFLGQSVAAQLSGKNRCDIFEDKL